MTAPTIGPYSYLITQGSALVTDTYAFTTDCADETLTYLFDVQNSGGPVLSPTWITQDQVAHSFEINTSTPGDIDQYTVNVQATNKNSQTVTTSFIVDISIDCSSSNVYMTMSQTGDVSIDALQTESRTISLISDTVSDLMSSANYCGAYSVTATPSLSQVSVTTT